MADTLIDSYSESNQDTAQNLYLSGYHATHAGQGFTGTGIALTSAKFYLGRYQNPTGNVWAELYTHTGTWGSSGKPDGTLLATSTNVIDASTLSAYPNFGLATFTFDGSYTLANGTHYIICVVFRGTDSSNFVRVGADSSSPTHAGNMSYGGEGTWSAQSGWDVCFYAYGPAAGAVLAGGISGAASLTGNAYGSVLIGGSMAASASCSGNLFGSMSISGSVSSSASASGDLFGSTSMAGAVPASSSVVGNILGSVLINGAALASASCSGDFQSMMMIVGLATGAASCSGNIMGSLLISGAASSSASCSGNLLGVMSCAGAVTASGVLSGNMLNVQYLNGQIDGVSSITGQMFQNQSMSGSSLASSSLTGILGFPSSFIGEVISASYLTGEIVVRVYDWLMAFSVTLPDEDRTARFRESRRVSLEEEQRLIKWNKRG